MGSVSDECDGGSKGITLLAHPCVVAVDSISRTALGGQAATVELRGRGAVGLCGPRAPDSLTVVSILQGQLWADSVVWRYLPPAENDSGFFERFHRQFLVDDAVSPPSYAVGV